MLNVYLYVLIYSIVLKLKYVELRYESDSSASSDVDFDDYGEFGYQLEPEYAKKNSDKWKRQRVPNVGK